MEALVSVMPPGLSDLVPLAGYPLGIAVLVGVFLMLLSGKLRIGSEVDKQLADKDKQIGEWQQIAQEGIASARRMADTAQLMHQELRSSTRGGR